VSWGGAFVELDTKLHDRNSFECGKEELNEFIKTKASKHMRAGISKTMLLPANNKPLNDKYSISSFYSIAPSSISRDSLPEKQAKKLPHYPIPVFLIAQLAVHVDFHGGGLGKVTLIKALENLYTVNKEMRAYAVVVDCIDDDATSFYKKYGFKILCKHNGRERMFISMNTVISLFER
jgi:GNAT superfamily N-acetyltransferase